MTLITWNVVNKNFHATPSLLQHIRERILELEDYLDVVPSDSAHLLIELARNLETDVYSAALSLRLPGRILRSQQSDNKDVKQAFDEAVKALVGELKSQKAGAGGAGQKARVADQPMPAGTGPQSQEELEREQAHA
ncbi:MAG: putative sigma 54 modulation protein/ribosomal protein [Pedosphaera sp.]|nr:putative sigma 54 modulation protein/ribosomal protein [Pedosphaera sp.]